MPASLEREIEALRALLHSERDPHGRAAIPLADAYRRAGELDRALALAADAVERLPRYASAHVVLAWIHADRGEPGGAEAAWRRVLALDEENVEALRGLGGLLQAQGRDEEARRYLERVRTLDPEERGDGRPAAAAAPAEGGPPETTALPETATPGLALQDEPMPEAEPFAQAGAPVQAEASPESVEPTEVAEPAEPEPVLELAAPEAPIDPGDLPQGDELPELEPLPEPEPLAELEPLPELEEPPELEELPELEEPPELEPLPELEDPGELPPVVAAAAHLLLEGSDAEEEWDSGAGEDDEDAAELHPTRTLAELFARQGLAARAIEIYQRLLVERPDDSELLTRLEELASGMVEASRRARAGVHADDTERMARELAAAGGAETGATPFAWTGQEAPADGEGEGDQEPVGEYFRRLLAWRPGGLGGEGREVVPIESLAPDAVPIESLAPDAVPIESLAPDAGADWPDPDSSSS